jgi:hypothetical protein
MEAPLAQVGVSVGDERVGAAILGGGQRGDLRTDQRPTLGTLDVVLLLKLIVGAMILASVVLTLIGLVRVYRSATQDKREFDKAVPPDDPDEVSFDQGDAIFRAQARALRQAPTIARNDAVLVGLGVVLGGAADGISLIWL